MVFNLGIILYEITDVKINKINLGLAALHFTLSLKTINTHDFLHLQKVGNSFFPLDGGLDPKTITF
jgi:hypothetical protein